jgi:hypothetical protein
MATAALDTMRLRPITSPTSHQAQERQGAVQLPLPTLAQLFWLLVIRKQRPSSPVLRAWRTPIGAAAHRGEVPTGGVIFPSAD